jgi:hypothetical protein
MAMMNGFMIGNEGVMIKLTKGETTLVFDQYLNTKGGFLSGIKMIPVLNQVPNTVFRLKIMIKTLSVAINKLHKILGYSGETHVKANTNAHGIKVFGKLEACKSCAISKSKQENTNKVFFGSRNTLREILWMRVLEEQCSGPLLWTGSSSKREDNRMKKMFKDQMNIQH